MELPSSSHITTVVKEAQKRLYFLQKPRNAKFWIELLQGSNRKHTDWKSRKLAWFKTGIKTQNIPGTIYRELVTLVE